MEPDKVVFMAKVTEQADRHEEMVAHMKGAAKSLAEKDLTFEERNLLAVGYTNVIGSRRSALRIISSIRAREDESGSPTLHLAQTYRNKLYQELETFSRDIIDLVDNHLLTYKGKPKELLPEPRSFYMKMKADYYRYLAEFEDNAQKRTEATNDAQKYYLEAKEIAKALVPTHTVRLSLMLNYAIFTAEVLHRPQDANALMKEAFDDALSVIDVLDEESYKDTTFLLQLMRDNFIKWIQDDEEQGN